MNRVNSRNGYGHDDSIVNVDTGITIIIIFYTGTQFPGKKKLC